MASVLFEDSMPKSMDRTKSLFDVKDTWYGLDGPVETQPLVDYRKRKSASVPEMLPKRRSLDKSSFSLAASHPSVYSDDTANHLEKIAEELPVKHEGRGMALPELTQLSIYCPAKDSDEDLQKFLEELLQDDEEEAKHAESSADEQKTEVKEEQIDFLNIYYRRRSKWSRHEIYLLWQGIAKHGNNWTALRGTCQARSYDQIKDKGRRCLSLLGWRSNRRKLETSSAHAKRIAQAVLAGMRDE